MMESRLHKCEANADPIRHLYVHIPFCARICPFCAFYKEQAAQADKDRFCDALIAEAAQTASKFPFALQSIYFGGGTPTSLTTTQLERVLRAIRAEFDVGDLREWTIEANPGSVSARKAETLHQLGVNRVSLGVQSWDDTLLRVLGREHDAAQARESFAVLRAAGFENLSIDLMFALPNQTQAQWQDSLSQTIALAPEHISTYCLTYEEDTEFLARFKRGEFRSDENDEADFFNIATEMLERAGYEQYETSNFAKPGHRSLHNQGYWAGQDYIALGPGAFSTRGMTRWQSVPDHREYARRIFASESAVASVEELTASAKRTERIALALRTSDGIEADLLDDHTVDELLEEGFVARENARVHLTRAGRAVADSVAEMLV